MIIAEIRARLNRIAVDLGQAGDTYLRRRTYQLYVNHRQIASVNSISHIDLISLEYFMRVWILFF